MLRADMDALPVKEATGLPYASVEVGTDSEGNEVPVMHACGHDNSAWIEHGGTAIVSAMHFHVRRRAFLAIDAVGAVDHVAVLARCAAGVVQVAGHLVAHLCAARPLADDHDLVVRDELGEIGQWTAGGRRSACCNSRRHKLPAAEDSVLPIAVQRPQVVDRRSELGAATAKVRRVAVVQDVVQRLLVCVCHGTSAKVHAVPNLQLLYRLKRLNRGRGCDGRECHAGSVLLDRIRVGVLNDAAVRAGLTEAECARCQDRPNGSFHSVELSADQEPIAPSTRSDTSIGVVSSGAVPARLVNSSSVTVTNSPNTPGS